ncbi:MAG: IclR family transcriptional regulator [Spirochaeta sp.]|jgi:IclR family KDG regulon transcriptional repressor|nr:IclR family transcriptional regulator [Spirochaeta sp.]
MSEDSATGKPVAGTVVTAARILEYIGDHGKVYPRDLARDLELNRSTVHRMLYTLEILHYVGKQPDGGYRLTFHLFEIGNSVPHSYDLIDTARRELIQLSHDTGLTVNHGVNHDDQVLYIDKATPPTYLQLDRSVGETEPLHCTSVGKVLLAFCPEEEREATLQRLSLDEYTPNTITSIDELRRETDSVRSAGYAIDRQELALEVRCVAVPVRRPDGLAMSAISLSGPEDRLTFELIDQLLPRLTGMAERIQGNIAVSSKQRS